MTRCALFDSPDVELYFYGELDAAETVRVEAHVRGCPSCRQRLDDLHAIRRALASRPAVDAPPAGDWSGFMRRLDAAAGLAPAHPADVVAFPARVRRGAGMRNLVALAAMLAIVAMGVFIAARLRHAPPEARPSASARGASPQPAPDASADLSAAARSARVEARALREVSAEHLERSKLVVLGLTTLDPARTRAADWQYERRLAGTLLSDTRLYRMAAQDRGLNDVARVMRDLETVLIETSMSDGADRHALARVQKLIARRDLIVKMQLVAAD
jgi:hypothetical protein